MAEFNVQRPTSGSAAVRFLITAASELWTLDVRLGRLTW